MGLSRGTALILAGFVVLSATMAVSAATAPDRDVGGDAAAPSTGTAPPSTAEGAETATASADSTVSPTGTESGQSTETAGQTDPGDRVLVGIHGGGPGWHEHGSVYLTDRDEVSWREDSADSYFDVTMLDNGSVLAGFMHSGYETGCDPYPSPCTKTGFRIIDPDTDGGPTVTGESSFPVRSESNSEVHDVERLGPGEYLFTDMEDERIVVVENGTVAWQWNASSFYNPPEDPTQRDWLHINDVDVIGDGRYLVSVRNANQLLVVERGSGVVEVINADDDADDDSCLVRGDQLVPDEDGDVRCGDPAILNHQHNPQWLGPGAVLVADSDNHRVVELHRDENTGEWDPVWALDSAGGLDFNWPRDADRLSNGNTLVTDTLHKRVLEVTPDGSVVWSQETDRIPYEADPVPLGEFAGSYDGSSVDRTPTGTATSGDATGTARATTDGDESGAGTTETVASGDGTSTATESTEAETPAVGTIAPDESRNFADANDGVPVLSLLLVAVKSLAPWLPVWFAELQLGLTVVSVGLVVGGSFDEYRRR